MNFGIIIYSNDPETVDNAFKLGVIALREGDEAKAFLLGKGVESETLGMDMFKVTDEIKVFTDEGGDIFASEECFKIRHEVGSEACTRSTLKAMYDLIQECDRVVTF